jgi:GNAT superfamily N-acetyltransferase
MMEINIRRAAIKDAEILPKIENSAGQAFRQVPDLAWFAAGADLPAEWHRRVIAQGTCWVTVDALDCPIGFLSAEVFSDELHIWELSVLYERQRAGLGRRLIQRSIDQAKSRDLSAITLTTFRDVPWNELFYKRLGFMTLKEGETGQHLKHVLQAEIERGWPSHRRCAMRLPIK